jgi:hypothetical protein
MPCGIADPCDGISIYGYDGRPFGDRVRRPGLASARSADDADEHTVDADIVLSCLGDRPADMLPGVGERTGMVMSKKRNR